MYVYYYCVRRTARSSSKHIIVSRVYIEYRAVFRGVCVLVMCVCGTL